jgi:hypothetical protein
VIRSKRKKPRTGRLKGAALLQLRELCFRRDNFHCVDCGRPVVLEANRPETGEMAHVRGKRMWGDHLSNVRTKCFRCHRIIEHVYGKSGEKPCPKKIA